MAESVRWHLEHSPPDTRIVLAAQLAGMLGADYVSLAVTHTADHTAELVLDAADGLGIGLVDLRGADADGGPDRIRSQSAFLHTDVARGLRRRPVRADGHGRGGAGPLSPVG